jgi:hypothetical protein
MITPSFSITATERVLPKLTLDFTTAVLDSRVTFTRTTGASNPATYVNSNGYITTATNDQPRFDYDPVTLICKGLLIEEARTNNLNYDSLYSNSYWAKSSTGTTWQGTGLLPVITDNYGVAPDGTNTASRLQFNLNGGTTSTDRSGISTFALTLPIATYTSSIYVKPLDATTDAQLLSSLIGFWAAGGSAASSISEVGNGWKRITRTITSTETSGTFRIQIIGGASTPNTMDLLLWGAQLEAGAFATSYIPTTTTALTRNADVATMTGTNFSDWFNASEGTFYTSSDTYQTSSTRGVLGVGDNTKAFGAAEAMYVTYASNRLGWVAIDGGVTQAALTPVVTQSPNVFGACVFGYKQDSFACATNGSAALTDTSGTIPTPVGLSIGGLSQAWSGATTYLNGHVAKVMYWPQRLTNNEVQAFSK